MRLLIFTTILFILTSNTNLSAQGGKPDSSQHRFTIHGQTTIISQEKSGFTAKYSGINSLINEEENQVSITSTLFAGAKLWKGASIYLNPEIAGGSGLSSALGIADATNGETFRVGSPAPKVFVARMYLQQIFAVGKEKQFQFSDNNLIQGNYPTHYISFTLGKVAISDFFDNNQYNHDPRTQFLSWGLMSSAAWDYPANTRGYTPSAIIEYITPVNEFRAALSLMPLTANGNDMNWDINKAHSITFEYAHKHKWLFHRDGIIRLLGFYTQANMGNYAESIKINPLNPDITSNRKVGRTKYGFAINVEQGLTDFIGGFTRLSWNDGQNETWAFTEIDRSFQIGLSFKGTKWNRKEDNAGIAYVISGISNEHKQYLQAGGCGFMLGDGNINYTAENLAEAYYSFAVNKGLFITGTYQLLINPGYNADRSGPVHVFSIRVHSEF